MNGRTIALLALAAMPAAALGSASQSDHAAVLAEYELERMNGETLTIGDLRGEVVVVNFWASWCKPCRKELGEFDEWQRNLAGKGARILAVSVDTKKSHAERFLRDNRLTLPAFFDGTDGLAGALDLPSLPCTYVLDANGDVAYIARSGSTAELAKLRTTIDDLVRSNKSAMPVTAGAVSETRKETE
ncbi:MAG: TlpA family protein disulfide reductase [Gemmatimonadetes bacterium]|nr:TlpA family protein disulfide reductase [Gemmatimonadota bacterium]